MKIRKVHVLNQDTLVVFFTDGTTGMYPVCDLLAWSQRVLPVRNKEIANDNLLAAAQSRLKPTVWSGAQVAGMPWPAFLEVLSYPRAMNSCDGFETPGPRCWN